MAKGKVVERKRNFNPVILMFTFAVSVVFSLLFTVIMSYLNLVQSDLRMIFIMMLIASNTTASAVALIFFLFFEKRLK